MGPYLECDSLARTVLRSVEKSWFSLVSFGIFWYLYFWCSYLMSGRACVIVFGWFGIIPPGAAMEGRARQNNFIVIMYPLCTWRLLSRRHGRSQRRSAACSSSRHRPEQPLARSVAGSDLGTQLGRVDRKSCAQHVCGRCKHQPSCRGGSARTQTLLSWRRVGIPSCRGGNHPKICTSLDVDAPVGEAWFKGRLSCRGGQHRKLVRASFIAPDPPVGEAWF